MRQWYSVPERPEVAIRRPEFSTSVAVQ